MKWFFTGLLLLLANPVSAESKRIEVYPLTQAYVDVKQGDSLSEIVYRLLPSTAARRQALSADIIKLNPEAFVSSDANRMKAGVRLWLPGYVSGLVNARQIQSGKTTEFSWGYIRQVR